MGTLFYRYFCPLLPPGRELKIYVFSYHGWKGVALIDIHPKGNGQ